MGREDIVLGVLHSLHSLGRQGWQVLGLGLGLGLLLALPVEEEEEWGERATVFGLLLTLLSLLLAMVAYQLLHCCYRHFRRRRGHGGLRFSSDELDGCDFATEDDFDNPAKKGGYDDATRVVNNIQVTLNLEVCGCGGDVKAREQTERVANILTKVVEGSGGMVVCKQGQHKVLDKCSHR